ncbi:MAG TPA: universal stress protein [Niabella sp.]|nr:universal stress protein [Niabella sp.]
MNAIIAALDLQEKTEIVLNKAAEMALKLNAELHLVHVIPPVGTYTGVNVMDPLGALEPAILPNEMELIDVHKKSAKEQLNKLVEQLPVKPAAINILLGSVEEEVVNYAQETGAEMIVVGTHQRSGLSRLLSGETSVRILHEAQIPILVIPTVENN